MAKAKVNGVDCVIYDYEIMARGNLFCMCYFPEFRIKANILASLIEVEYEQI